MCLFSGQSGFRVWSWPSVCGVPGDYLYGSPRCPQDWVFPPWPQAGMFSSHFLFLILCKNLPAAERRKSQITKNHVKTNDFSNCLGFKPFTQNSSFLCGIVDTNQWLAAWLLGTCVFLSWSPHSQEDVECRGSDQGQDLHEEESSQFFDLFGLSLGTKT